MSSSFTDVTSAYDDTQLSSSFTNVTSVYDDTQLLSSFTNVTSSQISDCISQVRQPPLRKDIQLQSEVDIVGRWCQC